MKKFNYLFLLLIACGKPTPTPPLGSCLSLDTFECVDFKDVTKEQVLNPDSVRFICNGLFGVFYGGRQCNLVVTNPLVGSCALPVLDNVEETYNFIAPVTSDAVQTWCGQQNGKFANP